MRVFKLYRKRKSILQTYAFGIDILTISQRTQAPILHRIKTNFISLIIIISFLFLFPLFHLQSPLLAGTCAGTQYVEPSTSKRYMLHCAQTFGTNIGAQAIPGYTCDSLGELCFKDYEIGYQCGVDGYTNPGNPNDKKITYCSVSNFGGTGLFNYGGCREGELCYAGASLGPNKAEWTVDQDGLKFCYGGFASEQAVRESRLKFECVGSSCGGAGLNVDTSGIFLAPKHPSYFDTSDSAPVGHSSEGYFTCIEPQWDQSFYNVVQNQIGDIANICRLGELGAFLLPATKALQLAAGAASAVTVAKLPITLLINTGKAATLGISGNILASNPVQFCLNAASLYAPTVATTVYDSSGNQLAYRELSVGINATGQLTTTGTNTGSEITPGTTVGAGPGPSFTVSTCQYGGRYVGSMFIPYEGIITEFGCIPSDPGAFFNVIVRFAIGIAGGIAFLLIILGGLKIVTSAGNPEAMNEGKEILSSAIVGLLLIIFSVFLLKFIGVDVLGIPGFG